MNTATVARPRPADPDGIIYYPDSDGQPMADNDLQYRCMVDTRFGLEQHYRDSADTYVGANLLIYYEEGDPGKSVAPDVFVVHDVSASMRRIYQMWAEGKPPDVVFEIASPRSWRADVGWKKGLYQGLGIQEYFLFDPSGDFFKPLLQGYRLEDDRYASIEPLDDTRGVRGLHSDALNLELWAQPGSPEMPFILRLFNPTAGLWLPTPDGEAEARRAAESRIAHEAEARRAAESRAAEAEARLRDLEAELRRLRGEV